MAWLDAGKPHHYRFIGARDTPIEQQCAQPAVARPSLSRRVLLMSGFAALVGGLAAVAAPTVLLPGASANRRFTVFYKGDKIGTHTVVATPETRETRVTTEIDLVVKAMFFTVFSFSHRSEESWRDGRLMSLKSDTVEHGERLRVEGRAVPRGFRVVSKDGPFIAPEGALTSNSLWTPMVLTQDTLVDAQHGGIIGVSARKLADESMTIAGREILTTRYRFITPYFAGSVWYDDTSRWVHGEFERDGAKIEYRLDA